MSSAEINFIEGLKADAVSNYEKYLSLNPQADDKDEVQERIVALDKDK